MHMATLHNKQTSSEGFKTWRTQANTMNPQNITWLFRLLCQLPLALFYQLFHLQQFISIIHFFFFLLFFCLCLRRFTFPFAFLFGEPLFFMIWSWNEMTNMNNSRHSVHILYSTWWLPPFASELYICVCVCARMLWGMWMFKNQELHRLPYKTDPTLVIQCWYVLSSQMVIITFIPSGGDLCICSDGLHACTVLSWPPVYTRSGSRSLQTTLSRRPLCPRKLAIVVFVPFVTSQIYGQKFLCEHISVGFGFGSFNDTWSQ